MTSLPEKRSVSIDPSTADSGNRWHGLADRVLDGHRLTAEEGLAILSAGDDQLLQILAAAYRVRHRRWGNRVYLNFLINAKSGRCGEDCGFCSQSRLATADVPKYDLLGPQQILDGARRAVERGARTYCIVLSGRKSSGRDLDTILQVVARIKTAYNLKICVSPGLLSIQQAMRLQAGGVDRINHNLNTSQRFYPKICTTHSYQDRLDTLQAVRRSGMEICCGGIVGMGEEDPDVVELALRLGELAVETVPVNFLQPIDGTAMEGVWRLNPRYCLKVLAMFRLANPQCELRIAAGREMHLGSLQPLGLYPANGIFIGDYLTTKGQSPEEDYRMIEALGFEAVVEGG